MSLAAKDRAGESTVKEPVVCVVHPWDVVVNEAEVILVPKPIPWVGIPIVCGLFIAFCALMYWPVWVWGEPESRWSMGLLFVLFAAFMCTVFAALIYFIYHSAQKEGPPLRIDRVGKTITVPRHQLCVPLDQIERLEVRNDMPDDQGQYRYEDSNSELILVVREEGGPKCYPLLLNSSSCDYYDKFAHEIAKLNILPVKRVKGVRGSKLVYEKWLTPPPAGEETADA